MKVLAAGSRSSGVGFLAMTIDNVMEPLASPRVAKHEVRIQTARSNLFAPNPPSSSRLGHLPAGLGSRA